MNFLNNPKTKFILIGLSILSLIFISFLAHKNIVLKRNLKEVTAKNNFYFTILDSLNHQNSTLTKLVNLDDDIIKEISRQLNIDSSELKKLIQGINANEKFHKRQILAELITDHIQENSKSKQKINSKIENLILANQELDKKINNLTNHKDSIHGILKIKLKELETLNKRNDSLDIAKFQHLKVIEFKKQEHTVYYIGEKINEKPHGYGVGLWSNGGMYKGEWKNGQRDGKGTYIWKDGEIYEGEWVDGKRNGEGKYLWKDRHYYIGSWNENKRHGYGAIYYPNGKMEYEGNWENDKFISSKKKKSK